MPGKTKTPSADLEHKRVSKIEGLAAFSPDALASIGYADQEVYLGLVVATGVTFVIVGAEKFFDGAWIAVLLIPILVALFLQVHGRGRTDTPVTLRTQD